MLKNKIQKKKSTKKGKKTRVKPQPGISKSNIER